MNKINFIIVSISFKIEKFFNQKQKKFFNSKTKIRSNQYLIINYKYVSHTQNSIYFKWTKTITRKFNLTNIPQLPNLNKSGHKSSKSDQSIT